MKKNDKNLNLSEVYARLNYAIIRNSLFAEVVEKPFRSLELVTANALLPSWTYNKGSRRWW